MQNGYMGWPLSTKERDDDINLGKSWKRVGKEQGRQIISRGGKRTAALNHKVWDDPMDDRTFVGKSRTSDF